MAKKIYKISTDSEITKSSESAESKSADKAEEDLLAVAKGVAEPEVLGIEEQFWQLSPTLKRDVIRYRREVRRGIYKILKYERLKKDWRTSPKLVQLHDIIDKQLDPNRGIRWETFADRWDIHPKEPLTIIIKEHWIKAGGGFDKDLGYHYPHAFTKKDE